MTRRPRRSLALALAGLAAVATTSLAAVPATAAPAATQAAAPTPIPVRVVAFNDFHGNLEPPSGSSGRVTQADGTTVDAGGAAFLATAVKNLRAEQPNTTLFSVGDNIGASPLPSALFHDEPTIDVLNQLGITASAIGNHELDEGYQELLRMQFGGCHPTDGCQFRPEFEGANFPFTAANMTFKDLFGVPFFNGFPAALPFGITFSGGVPIGYIGAPLQDLPDVVTADAVRGLQFTDEVAAINRSAELLDRLGVKTIVTLLHQGDSPTSNTGPDGCNTAGGPASTIASAVTPKVDVVFSAHSHQQYVCTVTDPAGAPRALVQGLSFGRLLTVADLQVDPRTRDVIRTATQARNVVVSRTVTPDPAVQAIVDEAVADARPIASRPVGTITADITRTAGPGGESPLGTVLGNAQLEATRSAGAQVAITNPGGIRTDLTFAGSATGGADGAVTYGEAFTTQPFANILQTITLTGAQLDAVLEQQYGTRTIVLQASDNLDYTLSTSAAAGSKISGITIDGVAVDPAASYRVTVNNFLAGGGDGFPGFTAGTNLTGGPIDLDAFTDYLTANPNLAPPATTRITTVP